MDVYVSNSGMIKPTKPQQDISTVNFLVIVESFIMDLVISSFTFCADAYEGADDKSFIVYC